MKKYLLTPGPTPLPVEVMQAQALPIIHHRTPEFQQIFSEVNEGLRYLFQTKNEVFIFAASGTGAMEAAVVNFLSPSDKAIVVCGGKFGERWVELCQTYKIEAVVLNVEWGQPVDPQEFKKLLTQNKEVKAVFTTLCETSTGVTNDIKAIAEVVKGSSAILVVDAISGLGAEDLKTDEWGVDCVVVGSQKGMMLPPGLAFCSVSAKAWKLAETAKLPRYYFDFKKAKKALDKNDTPYTPAVSLIVALRQSLNLIKSEGLDNIFKRHQVLAAATRSALTALGCKLFASSICNVVTSAYVPAGLDSSQLIKLMRSKYGVSIANGQGELKGKIIRIAHLGCMESFDVLTGISALEMALSELGAKIELGKGVQAAEKVLLGKIQE